MPLHPSSQNSGAQWGSSLCRCGPTQEEANKALGHLLVTRSSIDTHQRKQVSDFQMALCQKELETTEAIKEVKALSAHTIQDVKTHWTVLISKAEVCHTTHIKEIEDDCACASAEA